MKKNNNNIKVFFALLRAGLWEQDVCLSQFGVVDYSEVLRLSGEQSVVGLVTAGLEHVTDVKVPKEITLQLVGQSLQIEQRNKAMNEFVSVIVEKMRNADIYTLLVKGQGIGQCYERPLWRVAGDVDLLLSVDNYNKAKEFLIPLATEVDPEGKYNKHLALKIDSWEVELHGTLRSGLSRRIDRGLDELQNNVFYGGNVRSWTNGKTQVFLPSADNDAIYIFVHILQHFYKGGIGLRQICDWCRLLYTYRDTIDISKLERQVKQMGIAAEWMTFGAFSVDYLGMPSKAMPLYKETNISRKKIEKLYKHLIDEGRKREERDNSYYNKHSYIVRKAISFSRRVGFLVGPFSIFPYDTLRFFPSLVVNGLRSAANGE